MKIIKYQLMTEVNHGTEEEPSIVQTVSEKTIGPMSDDVFESNYAIAQAEAYNGEVTVEEIPDEEPATPTDAERIAELEAKLKAQDELIDILLGIEEEGGAV